MEYKNEYYKLIVQKRIDAYTNIERELNILKSVTIDDKDGLTYQIFFTFDREDFVKFYFSFSSVLDFSLWLDNNTVDILQEFNQLFYTISNKIKDMDTESRIIIGKQYYLEIANLRYKLIESIKKDMHNLYEVKNVFTPENNNTIPFKY